MKTMAPGFSWIWSSLTSLRARWPQLWWMTFSPPEVVGPVVSRLGDCEAMVRSAVLESLLKATMKSPGVRLWPCHVHWANILEFLGARAARGLGWFWSTLVPNHASLGPCLPMFKLFKNGWLAKGSNATLKEMKRQASAEALGRASGTQCSWPVSKESVCDFARLSRR